MTGRKLVAIGTLWILSLVGVAAITYARTSVLPEAVPLGSLKSGMGVALERDQNGALVAHFVRWSDGRWRRLGSDLGPMALF